MRWTARLIVLLLAGFLPASRSISVSESPSVGEPSAASTSVRAPIAAHTNLGEPSAASTRVGESSILPSHLRASPVSREYNGQIAFGARAGPEGSSPDYGFTFVRIQYDGTGYWRSQTWAYDYPRAERHLYEAIERTTGIKTEGPPIVLTLKDERIFEYPILYLCEPGFWQTDEEEVANLQRYFARGGFMIIDDFHDRGRGSFGPEWNNFYQNLKQIFPDREPVELPKEHPIWSIYYDIDPDLAVSTKWETGEVPWLTREDDMYFGIFDDTGRMVAVICYNQDIGDGWEWPEYNLADGSTVSFQMAINFIIYALTH